MELDGVAATVDQLKVLALTNYGHFTSMLVEGSRVRGLSLQMQRLARDCRLLFNTELDTDQVRRYIMQAIGAENPTAVVRWRRHHSSTVPSKR
jgi:branched-subunit amino acid aminotransferase/4-amino-4-deoxychorismate lyase